MAKRDAGSRGVLAQIDARLAELDTELARASELLAEQRRLLSARATLTGERTDSGSGGLVRRITQDQVAAYLAEHPGARASEIAGALGVPLTTISQHLHRGRHTRFERRQDGWHLRQQPRRGKPRSGQQ